MKRPWLRHGVVVFLFGVLTTAVLGLLSIFPPYFLRALDNTVYDTFLRTTVTDNSATLPVVVDVDDETLARYGQWPWPRYRVAALVNGLAESGALAVGVDFLFSEPDRTSLPVLAQQMRDELGLDLDFDSLDQGGMDPADLDNDARLAEALSHGPFVMGFKLLFDDSGRACPAEAPQLVWRLDDSMNHGRESMFHATGAVSSLDMFTQAASSGGFVNVAPDEDGVVRRVPMVIACNDTVQPSLGLALLMRAMGVSWISIRATEQGLEYVQVGDLQIPVDTHGNFMVAYKPAESVPLVSASRILGGELEPGELAGRIVIVGSTSQDLKDIYPTPVHPSYPALKIYAMVLDNILRGEIVTRPFWARGMELLMLLGAGVLLAMLLAWFRALWSALAALGTLAGVWTACAWTFADSRIYISPLWSSLTVVAVFLPCIWLKYNLEERKSRRNSQELIHTQGATIEALASVIETRDLETGEHIKRVQTLAGLLANRLINHPSYRRALQGDAVDLLVLAAPLHDIGKIGVPDRILQKPGRLTPEEFEEMKRHAQYGLDILLAAEDKLGSNPFLEMAKIVTFTHHERWDGTGYPQGLRGDDIPAVGRIMAIADVFDAVSSPRIYKPCVPFDEAMEIIAQGAGSHFDPDAVKAFLEMADEVLTQTSQCEREDEPED